MSAEAKFDFSQTLSGFGVKLFQRASSTDEKTGGNIFVSPLSVALCLQLARIGARGKTLAEFRSLFGIPDSVDDETINKQCADYLSSKLQETDKVKVMVANSMWLRDATKFRDEFVATARTSLQAEALPLTTASAINEWCSKHTNAMIDSLMSEIPASQKAILVNAVYFKGEWRAKFNPDATEAAPFYLSTGQSGGDTTTEPCKLMRSEKQRWQYVENDQFQAASLPYGDGKYAAFVLLPSQKVPLNSLIENLNADTWKQWLMSSHSRQGVIHLPRFKLRYGTVSLKRILSDLGLADAFARSADFSGMVADGGERFCIDDVVHQAVLEVDEEGTRAAAATAVKMRAMAAIRHEEQPFVMRCDRPFLFAIYDVQDAAKPPLFLGKVAQPIAF